MSGITVVSRFWMGREMPSDYHDYGQKWMTIAGAHRVQDDLDALPLDHADIPIGVLDVIDDIVRRDDGRNGIEMAVQIADVVGYLAVWARGGMYVNCDIEPLRRFDPPAQAWATYENDIGDVVNAAIGAPRPKDPFWDTLLDALPGRYFANPTDEMVKTTGPGLLTDHARAHPDLITILPKETFNSVHWSQIALGSNADPHLNRKDLPPGVIGVHHWGHKRVGRSNHVETATQG